jgi:putative FmdB family regulatory protein
MVRGRIAGKDPRTSKQARRDEVPLYEYTCQKCKSKFDQLVRAADRDSKIKCPECGSPSTARSLSLIAVGGESKGATSTDTPACGRCGEMGGCGM